MSPNGYEFVSACTMPDILLLNGPNLNLLGTREPEHYGAVTLEQILGTVRNLAGSEGVSLADFQSNAEHELVDRVQAAADEGIDFIIINPAALTHTSVGLRDALKAVGIPFIELHLSNVHAREEFRKHSYFSDIAVGVISGLGPVGYELALQAAVRYLREAGDNQA
jgi:3-dehydroquinate dehydratase-2